MIFHAQEEVLDLTYYLSKGRVILHMQKNFPQFNRLIGINKIDNKNIAFFSSTIDSDHRYMYVLLEDSVYEQFLQDPNLEIDPNEQTTLTDDGSDAQDVTHLNFDDFITTVKEHYEDNFSVGGITTISSPDSTRFSWKIEFFSKDDRSNATFWIVNESVCSQMLPYLFIKNVFLGKKTKIEDLSHLTYDGVIKEAQIRCGGPCFVKELTDTLCDKTRPFLATATFHPYTYIKENLDQNPLRHPFACKVSLNAFSLLSFDMKKSAEGGPPFIYEKQTLVTEKSKYQRGQTSCLVHYDILTFDVSAEKGKDDVLNLTGLDYRDVIDEILNRTKRNFYWQSGQAYYEETSIIPSMKVIFQTVPIEGEFPNNIPVLISIEVYRKIVDEFCEEWGRGRSKIYSEIEDYTGWSENDILKGIHTRLNNSPFVIESLELPNLINGQPDKSKEKLLLEVTTTDKKRKVKAYLSPVMAFVFGSKHLAKCKVSTQ